MSDGRLHITVNGEEKSYESGTDLVGVLRSLEIDPAISAGVAVAVNDTVIRRQAWTHCRLAPGDSVEIVTAQQGG